MRTNLNRFFDTAKLATLIGVAALLALGLVWATAPAQSAPLTFGVQTVGHDLPAIEQQRLSFRIACFDLDALTSMVEATHASDERFWEVTQTMIAAKMCFRGGPYVGVFAGIVGVMPWAETGDVVLVEVHDQTGKAAYTWFTQKYWDQQNIDPPGAGV